MKLNDVLATVAKTFASVKLGGGKADPKLAALDRGVLTVALLLAALDGTILPEEFAAFQNLATKCRGGSAEHVRKLLDAALTAVGRLMAMAQFGAYAEEERLSAFLEAAEKALPAGFTDGSMADVRRAFALWVVMGVSDGEFSTLERAAIASLADLYSDIRCMRGNAFAACVGPGTTLQPGDYAPPIPMIPKTALLEATFLAKAEEIARNLADEQQAAAAAQELEALIATVSVKGKDGEVTCLDASCVEF